MKAIKAKVQIDEPVTETLLEQAIEQGRLRRNNGLNATTLKYRDGSLVIGFEDGVAIVLPVKNYPEFDAFSDADFHSLVIGFSGTALCHEAQDLQVSIAGLISASKPLMDMAGLLIASRNGRRSSTAKSQAARANGKKGGRPRKVDVVL